MSRWRWIFCWRAKFSYFIKTRLLVSHRVDDLSKQRKATLLDNHPCIFVRTSHAWSILGDPLRNDVSYEPYRLSLCSTIYCSLIQITKAQHSIHDYIFFYDCWRKKLLQISQSYHIFRRNRHVLSSIAEHVNRSHNTFVRLLHFCSFLCRLNRSNDTM